MSVCLCVCVSVCLCVCVCVCVSVGKERERARERLVRATQRQQQLHNEYVLGLRAAVVQQQQHYGRLQPGLLSGLQAMQQEMVLIL